VLDPVVAVLTPVEMAVSVSRRPLKK